MGPSNPPYPVPNHASYPPSTQPSYSGPAASIPHVTQANLDTTNGTTAVSSTLKDEEIKLSLRSAVEDKIRRSTKALFQQAQVYIIRFELTVDCQSTSGPKSFGDNFALLLTYVTFQFICIAISQPTS